MKFLLEKKRREGVDEKVREEGSREEEREREKSCLGLKCSCDFKINLFYPHTFLLIQNIYGVLLSSS